MNVLHYTQFTCAYCALGPAPTPVVFQRWWIMRLWYAQQTAVSPVPRRLSTAGSRVQCINDPGLGPTSLGTLLWRFAPRYGNWRDRSRRRISAYVFPLFFWQITHCLFRTVVVKVIRLCKVLFGYRRCIDRGWLERKAKKSTWCRFIEELELVFRLNKYCFIQGLQF